MAKILIILLAIQLTASLAKYVPPGPAYPCPANQALLHPCVCTNGTDAGLYVECANSGLAAVSVGIGNIAGLDLRIERLILKDCSISRLFGPLFHRSIIRILYIEGSPIESIDQYAFAGVNRSLNELYLTGTKLKEFPKEAFKILGNTTVIQIDGHSMSSLGKDIFAGSAAAGRLERLHITNGLLTDIAAEAFQYLKKLKKLFLHGNRLAILKRNQFKGLRDTELLDLSYNNITKLDGSHIGDLTKLGWCNVSHNNIGDIPRGMFARNTVLKVLHLDNNKLKKLDTNSFRGMRMLRRLYLNDNQIAEIGRETFAAVTRIGTVQLARNRITKVDYKMFQQLKYAELIDLSENNITLIETQSFSDLYLAAVNISHNQLSSIEANSFINCNNLTVLDLSHNNLSEFTRGAFDGNTYAGEFQLSYNFIEDFAQIPIQNMSGIRVLNVSHNTLLGVGRNAFPKLYELHTVDLSHNRLTDIYNAVFQSLFSLRYLNLSHNAMTSLKPSTFGTLPTVLDLDLSHNQLTDVARSALYKLASCRQLSLGYNQLDKLFQIPISLSSLNLAHNAISDLGREPWPSMNSLLSLDLSNNRLSELADDSFHPLLTLQRLYLQGNGISAPPWQALNKLSSLQYLYLQDNNITSLSRAAFGSLPTLFHLDLSRNNLAEVQRHAFLGLQQLQNLTLSENRLQLVPNEAFKSLVALRRLDLSRNMLQRLDNKTHGLLDDCLSLEMINISHNSIGYVTKKTFPSSPWIPYRLRHVDLSHNSLPVLTMDFTHGTQRLQVLDVSYNGINDIRNYVLGNLTALEVLDLSGNDLKSLYSRSSYEPKLSFPKNLTHLYVSDNELDNLPDDKLVKCDQLKVLDVRGNRLGNFYPSLVNSMRHSGLEVLFEGNNLTCNCQTRPLKHFVNKIPKKVLANFGQYTNLTCEEPAGLQGASIFTLDEERLVCAGNTTTDIQNGDANFDFTTEPDLAFRHVQFSQSEIYLHWYVISTDDVADFFIYIRDMKNNIYYTNEVSYHLRTLNVPIDNKLKMAIQDGVQPEVCIQATTSTDLRRKWFPSQCKAFDADFNSWPKKLVVDKRKLTKKKVKYSWFSSNVLGLVGDSVLITLCIFLGVFFRRLADFDL